MICLLSPPDGCLAAPICYDVPVRKAAVNRPLIRVNRRQTWRRASVSSCSSRRRRERRSLVL